MTLIPKRLVEENTLGVRLWTLPSHTFCGLFVESGRIRACLRYGCRIIKDFKGSCHVITNVECVYSSNTTIFIGRI